VRWGLAAVMPLRMSWALESRGRVREIAGEVAALPPVVAAAAPTPLTAMGCPASPLTVTDTAAVSGRGAEVPLARGRGVLLLLLLGVLRPFEAWD